MENENEKTEQEETEEEANETREVLAEANKVVEKLELANLKKEELIKREEVLKAISGESEAGTTEKKEEKNPLDDPKEYAKAVFRGEINPLKVD